MSKSIFSAPQFNDEAAAYAFVEGPFVGRWPGLPALRRCGPSGALKGKSNRIGLYKCYACRKPFTVKVGTIFEASHIQMRDWLTAIHLICSSKKGISREPASPHLGNHPQVGMVHGATASARRSSPRVAQAPNGRRGRHCGSGRNLHRQ